MTIPPIVPSIVPSVVVVAPSMVIVIASGTAIGPVSVVSAITSVGWPGMPLSSMNGDALVMAGGATVVVLVGSSVVVLISGHVTAASFFGETEGINIVASRHQNLVNHMDNAIAGHDIGDDNIGFVDSDATISKTNSDLGSTQERRDSLSVR